MSNLLFDEPNNESYLRKHCWRMHPHFSGLWNRDGGEYMSVASALKVEREEQRQRDNVRNLRAMSSDDVEIKREIADRRRREIERVGSGRVEQKRYPIDGGWGEPDPK